jgi:hypothetical protein
LVGSEIHVYGRDETIADVRAKTAGRVRVSGHGTGMGVALIGASADAVQAARALADDVVAFDQRGWSSPRGTARVAAELDAALAEASRAVPRGELHPDERAEAVRYVETLSFTGHVFRGEVHAVGLAPRDLPLTIPPPGRHIHIAPVASLDEARALLADHAPVVVALGSDDVDRAARLAPPHARLSLLGSMQRPPLDGPVDRRDHGAR